MSGLLKVFLLLLPLLAINAETVTFTDTTGNKDYLVDYVARNWFQAWDYCRSQGYTLATIDTQQHHDLIFLVVKANYVYWTSGNYLANAGTFQWASNGADFSYTKWQSGEPNNPSKEQCVEAITAGWNDSSCSNLRYPICDRPSF